MFCRSVSVPFLLTIVLSVFLRFTVRFNVKEGTKTNKDPGGSMSLPNKSYKPITNTAWVRARLSKLQKGSTRLLTASDKVYQLLVHGKWFSPGTRASSTTKTVRHDIAEILQKVSLNTKH